MSEAVASPLLLEDGRGIPRSLPLLAALVEAEALSCAAAAANASESRPADSGLARAFLCCCATTTASRPAESNLVRSFRGGAAPKVPIRIFLERIHLLTRSVPSARGMVRIDGTCFVLAGIYLTRFIRSAAGRDAGILVEPATVHRLVAVAVLLAAKFGGHPPKKWTRVFQDSSEGAIRAEEMVGLESSFLRAIDFRLSVDSAGFDSFCKVLERGPRAPSAGGGCASKKRQADGAAGEDGEHRRVRARLPLPAVVLSN
ncbi:unnamed protein product [Urochloa decumbens]|uniref:Cyclin N-terminal domain-containing protein n=1 Tax=Urochloa decumbens TaxID=240449 RepID=A0ABC9DFR5_9POAL